MGGIAPPPLSLSLHSWTLTAVSLVSNADSYNGERGLV